MLRYLLTLAFEGSVFCGWQVQPNGYSVQQALCEAAEKIFGKKTAITGCSRTDSGVHAKKFCCHFDAETNISCERLPFAFNNNLMREISVLDCISVAPDFHARYSCKGKKYVYRILNSAHTDPFEEGRAMWFKYPLNIDAMNMAAADIIGEHDFSAFCAAGSTVEDKVRTVKSCEVLKKDNIVEISVSANGFLYNMVRIIAGTLIDAGTGRTAPEDIKKIISSKDRALAGVTAPAHGLYLSDVYY